MDKNQKIVMVLLIVAIVFSVISIIISVGIANIDLSPLQKPSYNYIYKLHDKDTGSGTIGLIVEKPAAGGGK